jgi:hypothetical protein
MRNHFIKVGTQGFTIHFILPVAAMFAVAGIGMYMLTGSHAATTCYAGTYGQGSSGHCVYDIQVLANYFDYGTGGNSHWIARDSKYGPSTANAVKAIQRSSGLTTDGVVGNHTWPALCSPKWSKSVAYAAWSAGHNAGCPGY